MASNNDPAIAAADNLRAAEEALDIAQKSKDRAKAREAKAQEAFAYQTFLDAVPSTPAGFQRKLATLVENMAACEQGDRYTAQGALNVRRHLESLIKALPAFVANPDTTDKSRSKRT